MKKLIGLCCFLFIVSVSFSQKRTDLKGPAAKNFKPWMSQETTQTSNVLVISERPLPKGPTAKNAKPWEAQKLPLPTLEVVSSRSADLKGPKAKNRKPWQSEAIRQPERMAENEKSDSSSTSN